MNNTCVVIIVVFSCSSADLSVLGALVHTCDLSSDASFTNFQQLIGSDG